MDTAVSHIPRASRNVGLTEMNASELNSRPVKHHISGLPEPAPKRKTLVERAAEPIASTAPAPQTTRTGGSAIPTGSLQPQRATSFSRSVSQSYRSNSAAPRTVSSNSFSSSVGPSGIRNVSGQTLARPRTAMAGSRVASRAESRPASALETQGKNQDSHKQAWDVNEKYSNIERMHQDIIGTLSLAVNDSTNIRSIISGLEKDRDALTEANLSLTESNMRLTEANFTIKAELETAKYCLTATERTIEDLKTEAFSLKEEQQRLKQSQEAELLELKQKNEAETLNFKKESQELKQYHQTEAQYFKDEVQNLKKDHEQVKNNYEETIRALKSDTHNMIENERLLRIQAVNQASTADSLQKQQRQIELDSKEQNIRQLMSEMEREQAFHKSELERWDADLARKETELERERALKTDMQMNILAISASSQALQAKIEYLESDNKTQSNSYAAMERQMSDAIERAVILEDKLRKAETFRRKQHDKIQQLSGNIRVICRTRPALESDASDELAQMTFPDTEENKEIEIKGPEERSSLGKVTTKTHPFSFDRSFNPSSNNKDIFEEISPLIQSSVDGYNVCVFAYGQTGSGKTYTMSSDDGMIAQALRQIYDTTKSLEERGWSYAIQGSFVEVYNEEINDLLGNSDDMDKRKHEVRHDMQKSETTVTGVTVVDLDSAEIVESLLTQAMSKRSVAATKLNERSSRSHSVFILKLSGHNHITGESSKGTLNLVDLAGSERVSHSKVEGARLKETQNINKSLSCLGDVIGALGSKEPGAHIPYRNSKLTYLLQFSLGGNSKTLMFVMVSPLKEHLGETLTSLKFATKVNATHIGTAKKASKS